RCRDAQTVARSRNARFIGHVGEGAVAVVVVEGIPRPDAAAVQVAPVQEVQVGPTVAIVVKESAAGARLLQDRRNASVTVEVAERDSGRRGRIDKEAGARRVLEDGGKRGEEWG